MTFRRTVLLLLPVLVLLGGPLLMPPPDAGNLTAGDLADPDSRFAPIDGVSVHHKVAGSTGDPAVLLLHHFFGNAATWRHVLDDLGRDHRAVAYDRPGFGLTERPVRSDWANGTPYSRAASAGLAIGLLDELGERQAVLVGSSAGGTVALEAYARAPERVRALVLLSPAITGDVGPPSSLRPLLRSPQARRLGPRVVRRMAGELTRERVARSWHDPSRASADDVDAYRRPLRMAGWDRALWDVVTAEAPPDLRTLLPRIEVPTLVVTGAGDRVVSPRSSARTARAIPGARFQVLPDCGHTPQEECPQALLEVVRAFLDGV